MREIPTIQSKIFNVDAKVYYVGKTAADDYDVGDNLSVTFDTDRTITYVGDIAMIGIYLE